jgi:hypothetical protein
MKPCVPAAPGMLERKRPALPGVFVCVGGTPYPRAGHSIPLIPMML